MIAIITEDWLINFKNEILNEVRSLLNNKVNSGDFVRNKEAQGILGCSQSKLDSLRLKGDLPFTKVGATCYYKREDLNRLLGR